MANHQYRKKPVVIEAFQLTKETRWSNQTWPQWMHDAWKLKHDQVGALLPVPENRQSDDLVIQTLEGPLRASCGSWIIRGVRGELYACDPDIFEETYDKA